LHDRLGILCTAEDPNAWPIGQATTGDTVESSKTLRAVTSLANPADDNKMFALRLTTVIQDDIMLDAAVSSRVASPTQYERRRRVDGKDHFFQDGVHLSSDFFADALNAANPRPKAGTEVVYVRDDTIKARAHAISLRAATEMPKTAGSVVIPYITNAIEVSDRIKKIQGRNVSLRTNTATAQGEIPWYPFVVVRSWDFSGDRQSTTLQLSDRREQHARRI
jgi:hypothetical protein